jgi:hypothetical protein
MDSSREVGRRRDGRVSVNSADSGECERTANFRETEEDSRISTEWPDDGGLDLAA